MHDRWTSRRTRSGAWRGSPCAFLLMASCTYQPLSMVAPPCYPNCVEGCVIAGAEQCGNGLDDDCDGLYDEGPDNKGCPCAMGSSQTCGTDVGECVSGRQDCIDGIWGTCIGVVGPTDEICGDALDNNCDSKTDEDCPCANGAKQPCGDAPVGNCQPGEQLCIDGYWGDCTGGVGPSPEHCDNRDNNCNGSTDEGCDDDGDDFCDAAMPISGTPDVCPRTTSATLVDCNDTAAHINPGVREICIDTLDNDCNLLVDFDDTEACPRIGIRIVDPAGPTAAGHGQELTLQAMQTPALDPTLWPRTWSVVDASGAEECRTSDLVLLSATDTADRSTQTVRLPVDAAKMGCTYLVAVRVHDYAYADVPITVTNRPPRVVNVPGATWSNGEWVLDVWDSSASDHVQVEVADDDDLAITVIAEDGAGHPIACGPCLTPSATTALPYAGTVTFAWSAIPAEQYLRVSLNDGYGAVTAVIRLQTRPCIWVRSGGVGYAGSDPEADAFATVVDALGYVRSQPADDAAICLAGGGVFDEPVVLSLPTDPHLLAGFDLQGARSTTAANRPTLNGTQVPLTLRDGYSGTVRGLILEGSGNPAVVDIINSTALLDDCIVNATDSGVSATGVGVRILNQNTSFPTAPRLQGNRIGRASGVGPTATFTAVAIDGGSQEDTQIDLDGNSSISALLCTELCRAIAVSGATASIQRNQTISASSSGGIAVAIDLAGHDGRLVSASIRNNHEISIVPSGNDPTHTAVIRMVAASGVEISGNDQLGGFLAAHGSRFAVAIIDGAWDAEALPLPGASTGVTITDNQLISPGVLRSLTTDCMTNIPGRGPAVSAGILLYGTSGAAIEDNGRAGDAQTGIWGGLSTSRWDPAIDPLLPSAVGLWSLNTTHLHVRHNQLYAGALAARGGLCTLPPQQQTPVAAFRDGMPSAAADDLGLDPSTGLWLDGNGIICGNLLGPASGPHAVGTSACVGVELNQPTSVDGNLTLLTNNYVAATYGPHLRALWQRGGSAVVSINNTFETETLQPETAPKLSQVHKHAIAVELIESWGLTMVNNVLIASGTNQDFERCAIFESATTSRSRVRALKNNQLWVEPAIQDASTITEYFSVVTLTASRVNYTAEQLNSIPDLEWSSANFAAPPGWLNALTPEGKACIRLSPYLPAVDAGHQLSPTLPIPETDIDGDSRTIHAGARPDIGHDELVPITF